MPTNRDAFPLGSPSCGEAFSVTCLTGETFVSVSCTVSASIGAALAALPSRT